MSLLADEDPINLKRKEKKELKQKKPISKSIDVKYIIKSPHGKKLNKYIEGLLRSEIPCNFNLVAEYIAIIPLPFYLTKNHNDLVLDIFGV